MRNVLMKKICKKENAKMPTEGIATNSEFYGQELKEPAIGDVYIITQYENLYVHTSTIEYIYTYNKDHGKAFCPAKFYPKNINQLVDLKKGDILLSTLNSIYHIRYVD